MTWPVKSTQTRQGLNTRRLPYCSKNCGKESIQNQLPRQLVVYLFTRHFLPLLHTTGGGGVCPRCLYSPGNTQDPYRSMVSGLAISHSLKIPIV